jgi:predicted nucleotide-binding protein (sugar kinase/HSP70/actin superfamily)
MKVTFPHLGHTYIPIEALLQGLGHEPITPPLTTKRTLEWGSRLSPEETCLPFKTILGNMLEGIELGADTVYMIGGWGPCRLGYYAEIQRIILADLGKQVEFITLEVPRGGPSQAWQRLRKIVGSTDVKSLVQGAVLSWTKLKIIDELENLSLWVRPRERERGSTSRLLEGQLQRIREAQSIRAMAKVRDRAELALQDLIDPKLTSDILRVGLVGEIYVAAEPFVNLRLEERLGYLGVEVVRTIHLPQWVEDHIFKNALGLYKQASLKRSAAGYLEGFVGGHGLESVARSVDLARQELDGIIHILPLACMPEVIAQGILPKVSADKGIPIMSLVVDEHGGEIGFQTRLEAFVDLLQRRASLCAAANRSI